ncbi:hypothetical protein [Nostoc piscinale]|uniref:hypothetical protein n=1 Tax=Nostoc piscinale TaxID=224012 RepID=UPI000B077771|nr:hypothetical protein [Nostoc piscinale]
MSLESAIAPLFPSISYSIIKIPETMEVIMTVQLLRRKFTVQQYHKRSVHVQRLRFQV